MLQNQKERMNCQDSGNEAITEEYYTSVQKSCMVLVYKCSMNIAYIGLNDCMYIHIISSNLLLNYVVSNLLCT